jgi:chromosomal replication initiation ATPase DnaA
MHPLQANAMELRRRLRTPVNGINSSELEIVPHHILQKERARTADEARRAAARAERRAAMDQAIEKARSAYEEKLVAAKLEQIDLPPKPPKLGVIIAEICDRYHVTEIELLSKRRLAGIVLPRQIAMYLCKTLTFKSLPEIGRRLGGKDHTTVLHAVRKIARLVENFPHLAEEIADIKKSLGVE